MSDPTLTLLYEFARRQTLASSRGLGPTLDIVRASNATYFDAQGILQTAGNGVARFDHSPVSKVPLGLLVEEARTNIGLHSEDTSNAAWVATNMAKGSDAVITPKGISSTTVRLTATSGNATLLQSITSTISDRAFAVFIKRVTGSGNIQLTVDGGATWTTITVTSDWVRLSISQLAVLNPQIGVRIVTSGDAIDFFGSDIQIGDFITSYIHTAFLSITRNADVVSTTDMSWFSSGVGTIYVEHMPTTLKNGARILELHNGENNRVVDLLHTTGDGSGVWYFGSNGASIQSAGGVYASNTVHRTALSIAEDDYNIYVDGTSVGTDLATTAVPVPTTLHVGCNSGPAAQLNGQIKELRYYNVRKDNQFRQQLSSGNISNNPLDFSRPLVKDLVRPLSRAL